MTTPTAEQQDQRLKRYFAMSQLELVTECARLHAIVESVAGVIAMDYPGTAALLQKELNDGAIYASGAKAGIS